MVIMLFLGFKAIRRIAGLALIAAIGFTALSLTGLSLTGCPTDRGIETVARPTATPEAGPVASGSINVTLKTTTPGADIFYTINGNTPTKNDPDTKKFNDPIPITPPVTITAIAVKYGMYNSEILKAEYTVKIPSDAILLAENKWADGELTASNNVQWFKFTASASTQYIHANLNGTMSAWNGLYIQVYDSSGVAVGKEEQLSGSGNLSYKSITVTSGQEYYIKVRPYSSSSTGTYQIAFNSKDSSSSITITPPSDAKQLAENKWADGELTVSSDEQWFKFTATAGTQYIHVGFGTLSSSQGLYVQVYDSSGAKVGTEDNLYGSSGSNRSRPVTAGQEYYIKVRRYNSYNGTYQIAFAASSTAPPIIITLPSSDVTQLTENKWEDGNLTASNNVQWFKFTASASTQYIHAAFSTLDSLWGVYVQVCDSSGVAVGTEYQLYGNNDIVARPVTISKDYYIRVRPYSSSYTGAYQIMFNKSPSSVLIPLPSGVTQLTLNTWANGNFTATPGEQWFKFTATANPQYIHVSFGTLSPTGGVLVQVYEVYNSNCAAVGDELYLGSSTRYRSISVTAGQEYYIKVRPYSSTGTYQIGFTTSTMAPSP